MTLEQLEKLEKNPHYKLSDKQKAELASYRAKQFRANSKFKKHQTSVQDEPNARTNRD